MSPAAAIRRDDRVVVKVRDGRLIVRELRRRTARAIELRTLDSSRSEDALLTDDIDWIARIAWVSQ